MSAPFANLEISYGSNPNFSNASYGDLMMYTGSRTQNIHLGVDRGSNSELKISKSNVTFFGSVNAATGLLTIGPTVSTAGSNMGTTFPYNIGIQDVTNLQSNLDLKLDKAGGVITGDITANSNLNVRGVTTLSNNVTVNSNLSVGQQLLLNSNDSLNAPAYSWANDSNTGLYHPANDTIGVVTNGIERLRIASNGFVGIGTNNPVAAVDLNGICRFNGMICYGFAFGVPQDTNVRYIYFNGVGPSVYNFGGKLMLTGFGYNDWNDTGYIEYNFTGVWNGSSGRITVGTATGVYGTAAGNIRVGASNVVTANTVKMSFERTAGGATIPGNFTYSAVIMLSCSSFVPTSITFGS